MSRPSGIPDEMIPELIRLAKAGYPAQTVARILGKTYNQVAHRARKLGVGFNQGGKRRTAYTLDLDHIEERIAVMRRLKLRHGESGSTNGLSDHHLDRFDRICQRAGYS